MMVTFQLPAYLRQFADGKSKVLVDALGPTVEDALSALWLMHPSLQDRVISETGEVRRHVNIFVGDESVRFSGGLATKVPASTDVWIIPAISGGAPDSGI